MSGVFGVEAVAPRDVPSVQLVLPISDADPRWQKAAIFTVLANFLEHSTACIMGPSVVAFELKTAWGNLPPNFNFSNGKTISQLKYGR